MLTLKLVGQIVDRLAFPHAGLERVQLDLAAKWCVLCQGFYIYNFVYLKCKKNHGTQDSHVVPHHGTNWAALWLTSQIRRDAVLSKSYGRGWLLYHPRGQ